MQSLNFKRILTVAFVLAVLSFSVFSQQTSAVAPPAPSDMVLEVMYVKGSILAYQRIGDFALYGYFKKTAARMLRPDELPVDGVKVATRVEDGVIKARIAVVRGTNHEVEEFVAEYVITPEKRFTVSELANVGIEPFEMQLVRAPSTVVEPPAVINKTRSLQVSTEPTQSTIPTFLVRVLNNSPKPVASFSYYTSVGDSKKLSGGPRNPVGEVLIKPGGTYQARLRYAMKTSTASTGEVPSALPNLVFNVTSVVFTDGTYEGDPLPVANFLAIKIGEKAQLQSFLDIVQSKGSPGDLEAAKSSVNVDSLVAEITSKFPTLTEQDKAQLPGLVDLGKSNAVKFFKSVGAEPAAALVERLRMRIEMMP